MLEAQQRLRERLEAEPVRFLSRELEGLLDAVRESLADFIGAHAADLAFVPNATAGVNTVLRSLCFERGDEILITDHAYNACRNAVEFVAQWAGLQVVVARVRFPIDSPDVVVDAVVARVTPRTRLALLDHVTSPTGLVFPISRLVGELAARGVDTLVDGAHAPGMVPVDLGALDAAYYAGNCHKWLCAPKGSAFLHVRRDRQAAIRPLSISHGANSPRTDRSRFRLEFDWTGTHDPTPYLSVPEAIGYLGSLMPGGWPALMARNRDLAQAARRTLCDALGMALPSPDEMIGALATVPLPDAPAGSPVTVRDELQDELFAHHRIEVSIPRRPAPPRRLVRVSAQLYNTAEQYAALAAALTKLLDRSAPRWGRNPRGRLPRALLVRDRTRLPLASGARASRTVAACTAPVAHR